jgi:SAM-dependent methyltransferase
MADNTSPFDDGEIYDAILGDLDYGIDFYVKQARQADGPVLDIACGTGRILLPCWMAGVPVDGLDSSRPMLDRLQQKADALHFMPKLYQADMAGFTLPHPYSLIMITFNAFGHNLTTEAQIDCLKCCKRHLMPGGKLVFDASFPGLQWIGAPQHTRVLELTTTHPRTGETLQCYDTRSFDRVRQIQHSINEIEASDASGKTRLLQRSEFDIRWVYKDEMALLLRVAGFPRWEILGNFEGKDLTDENDSLIVHAWNDAM